VSTAATPRMVVLSLNSPLTENAYENQLYTLQTSVSPSSLSFRSRALLTMPGGILPPLSVMGSWPTPNYTNPVQRGWGLVVVTTLLTVLSFSVVCARLWARIKLRGVGIDDVIIIATMVRPAMRAIHSDHQSPQR
jgi:hypothetical protein